MGFSVLSVVSKIAIQNAHTHHTKNVKKVKHSQHSHRPQVVIPQPIEKKVNFDLEITEFEIRVAMSASVLIFSMGMLAARRGDPGMYLPLITGIVSYWTPSPTKKKD